MAQGAAAYVFTERPRALARALAAANMQGKSTPGREAVLCVQGEGNGGEWGRLQYKCVFLGVWLG